MRVLLVVHGFPPRAQGGAELYAHAHAAELAERGETVLVLTREADPSCPEYAVRRERRNGFDIAWINNTFAEVRSFEDTYRNDRLGAVASGLIDAFAPDVAHVHHLTCLSTTIVADLAARRVPIFCTLHDYWLLCGRGQLLDVNLQVCTGPGREGCGGCLGPAASLAPGAFTIRSAVMNAVRRVPSPVVLASLRHVGDWTARRIGGSARRERAASAARLAHMRATAARITRFFTPSQYLRHRIAALGVPQERITLSDYGCELPGGVERREAPADARGGQPLRLGFLGSLMVSKAPHLLLEACARLPPGSVLVDLAGEHVSYHGDRSYRQHLTPSLSRANVVVRGRIARSELAAWLAGIDVLVVPSIWPENSPFVIREAFLASRPVVASRIGGIPELVTEGVNGLLFTPGDVADLARGLKRLLDDPALLDRLRRSTPPVRSLADDVDAMRRAYREALRRPVRRLAAVVLNYRTAEDTYLAVRSLLHSRRVPDRIYVVDNDASPACRTALLPILDRVAYLPMNANLGFSGGMNAGIRRALAEGADQVLLVNSDMIVPPDCIGALEEALDRSDRAGIAGPIVLARQAPDRVASAGMTYRPVTGRMRHHGYGASLADLAKNPVGKVSGVIGCLMLITREVFDTAGLFDEGYFFGFEDLDFCLRARDAGFGTVVASRALAFHEGGRSIGAGSLQRLYFGARNHLRLAGRAHRGTLLAAVTRGAAIALLSVVHAWRAPGATRASRLAAAIRGTRDYVRGVDGPDPRQRPPAAPGPSPARRPD
jgi:GT2 family glycosyltransferase/glycosyltransferase involved in cell wall biosynthesis